MENVITNYGVVRFGDFRIIKLPITQRAIPIQILMDHANPSKAADNIKAIIGIMIEV